MIEHLMITVLTIPHTLHHYNYLFHSEMELTTSDSMIGVANQTHVILRIKATNH